MTENKKNAKQPLFHIVKRELTDKKKILLVRVLAVVAALVISGIFITLTAKINPFLAFADIFKGAFGNKIYIRSTLKDVAKLLLIGLALAPAFKMRFWNIGAEGQMLVGALATAIVMQKFTSLPNFLLILFSMLASMIAGAIWGVIPALFKAKWETNETLFTLMLNYIAIQLVDFFYNKWKGSKSSLGQINASGHQGWFYSGGIFFDGFWTLLVALILMAVMYFYLEKSKHGYEITVVGESRRTARYAGISVPRVLIRTMVLSGLIAGLTGGLTVAGVEHTISSGTTTGGYGFTAIIVTWLSKFNPFVMAGVSVLIAALQHGTNLLTSNYSTFPKGGAEIVVGLVLFFIIGSEFFLRYRVVFNKKEEENA